MTNIVVGRQRNIHITSNATAGIIQTTVPVTLKNTPTLISGNSTLRVENLTNVNSAIETDGSTLVYDAETATFIVEPLNLSNLVGALDGGTF